MIVITGATGFIGSNIVADFNEQGRTDLLLVDDLGSQGKWKNIAKRRFLNLMDYRDLLSIGQQLRNVEAVFHMGANSSTTSVDGDEILRVNLHASMHWWKWCTEHKVPLFYASSAATYGDGTQGFVDDQSPQALDRLRPLNLYGWSKHQFDKWAVERAAEGYAPPQWAGLKFFNVYGPNEYHKADMRSLVAKNTALIQRGDVIKLFKSHKDGYVDGGQLRDFVYVKDCTAFMLNLLKNKTASGIFNVGTGKARTFYDLMQAIGAALGKSVNVEYVEMPENIRHNYQYFTQASVDKIMAASSGDFYSVEDGVLDYVSTYLSGADAYR
jgi:ADP-L-glycero-D-manno-heptose 6-epimerase